MSAAPRRHGPGSALLGMIGVAVVAGVMLTVGVVPAIALTGTGAKNGIGLFQNLPDDLKITKLQQKTEIYATDKGEPKLIASFYNQNREVIKWPDVPATVRNATLAAEDVRFYDHGGVDPMGILRAIVSNVGSGGSQGASTISQQYVKNVCIQQAELLPTETKVEAAYEACTGGIQRKLKEARLAIGLEKTYSKNQILLGYLNIAGFGGRIYGIESAAQYYFDTHAKDLKPAQAASLMAIVNAPNDLRLDEKANLAANKVRRDYILGNELKHDMISASDYRTAIATPVKPKITPTTTGCAAAGGAGYFCNYVVNAIVNDSAFGKDSKTRWNNLQSAGWKIYTTLDMGLERKAKATMTSYVPSKSPVGTDIGGAAISVESGTGRIISMVQSKRFDETGGKGTKGKGYTATAVNWNTDYAYGGSGGFQPASTYKLFTLLDWLKQGHGLYEQVNGSARTLAAGDLKACNAPAGSWTFGNDEAGEGGYQTVMRGTAGSVNGVFASMAEQLDLCDIRKEAEALLVHPAKGGELNDYPSSILGTNTVSPLSMATAYAAIADQGMVCSPVAIDKVVQSDGSQLPVPKTQCEQAVPKSIAIAAGYALHGVLTGGTAASDIGATGSAYGLAKTGTSDDAYWTWEVGGTSKTTTAVMVGNIGSSTSNLVNLRDVYGFPGCGGQAAQARHCIWSEIQEANQAKEPGDTTWPQPDTKYLYGQQVAVPNVVGQTVDAAKSTLKGAGFRVQVGEQVTSDQPVGLVASTDPGANAQASAGALIKISPSSGPAAVQPAAPAAGQVPQVIGARIQDAKNTLAAAGFTNLNVQYHPEVQTCLVVTESPGAGTQGDGSTQVTLDVAGAEAQCQ